MQILICWKLILPFQSLFSVDTLEDILLLLQNLLTDRDERPRAPGNLYFKTQTACLLVREFLVLNQINDHIFIDKLHTCTSNF